MNGINWEAIIDNLVKMPDYKPSRVFTEPHLNDLFEVGVRYAREYKGYKELYIERNRQLKECEKLSNARLFEIERLRKENLGTTTIEFRRENYPDKGLTYIYKTCTTCGVTDTVKETESDVFRNDYNIQANYCATCGRRITEYSNI